MSSRGLGPRAMGIESWWAYEGDCEGEGEVKLPSMAVLKLSRGIYGYGGPNVDSDRYHSLPVVEVVASQDKLHEEASRGGHVEEEMGVSSIRQAIAAELSSISNLGETPSSSERKPFSSTPLQMHDAIVGTAKSLCVAVTEHKELERGLLECMEEQEDELKSLIDKRGVAEVKVALAEAELSVAIAEKQAMYFNGESLKELYMYKLNEGRSRLFALEESIDNGVQSPLNMRQAQQIDAALGASTREKEVLAKSQELYQTICDISLSLEHAIATHEAYTSAITGLTEDLDSYTTGLLEHENVEDSSLSSEASSSALEIAVKKQTKEKVIERLKETHRQLLHREKSSQVTSQFVTRILETGPSGKDELRAWWKSSGQLIYAKAQEISGQMKMHEDRIKTRIASLNRIEGGIHSEISSRLRELSTAIEDARDICGFRPVLAACLTAAAAQVQKSTLAFDLATCELDEARSALTTSQQIVNEFESTLSEMKADVSAARVDVDKISDAYFDKMKRMTNVVESRENKVKHAKQKLEEIREHELLISEGLKTRRDIAKDLVKESAEHARILGQYLIKEYEHLSTQERGIRNLQGVFDAVASPSNEESNREAYAALSNHSEPVKMSVSISDIQLLGRNVDDIVLELVTGMEGFVKNKKNMSWGMKNRINVRLSINRGIRRLEIRNQSNAVRSFISLECIRRVDAKNSDQGRAHPPLSLFSVVLKDGIEEIGVRTDGERQLWVQGLMYLRNASGSRLRRLAEKCFCNTN